MFENGLPRWLRFGLGGAAFVGHRTLDGSDRAAVATSGPEAAETIDVGTG